MSRRDQRLIVAMGDEYPRREIACAATRRAETGGWRKSSEARGGGTRTDGLTDPASAAWPATRNGSALGMPQRSGPRPLQA